MIASLFSVLVSGFLQAQVPSPSRPAAPSTVWQARIDVVVELARLLRDDAARLLSQDSASALGISRLSSTLALLTETHEDLQRATAAAEVPLERIWRLHSLLVDALKLKRAHARRAATAEHPAAEEIVGVYASYFALVEERKEKVSSFLSVEEILSYLEELGRTESSGLIRACADRTEHIVAKFEDAHRKTLSRIWARPALLGSAREKLPIGQIISLLASFDLRAFGTDDEQRRIVDAFKTLFGNVLKASRGTEPGARHYDLFELYELARGLLHEGIVDASFIRDEFRKQNDDPESLPFHHTSLKTTLLSETQKQHFLRLRDAELLTLEWLDFGDSSFRVMLPDRSGSWRALVRLDEVGHFLRRGDSCRVVVESSDGASITIPLVVDTDGELLVKLCQKLPRGYLYFQDKSSRWLISKEPHGLRRLAHELFAKTRRGRADDAAHRLLKSLLGLGDEELGAPSQRWKSFFTRHKEAIGKKMALLDAAQARLWLEVCERYEEIRMPPASVVTAFEKITGTRSPVRYLSSAHLHRETHIEDGKHYLILDVVRLEN